MLQIDNRLAKTRDFNLIIKHGQWVSGRILTLKWLELAKILDYFPKKVDPTDFQNQLKLAISVGLKYDKRAVVRNRTRRQIREALRLLIRAGRVRSGYYMMFVPKSAMKTSDFAEISQEVELLLRRINVLV